ncbi:MAG: FAD-dependent oxidoreductase [Bacteriovoracaceae bacterium]|jgi:glycerol-3-phosphate dehydrogenase|nr:FAD-dependent oxidoreductase [Bacteriovoracaceae bacterium]
MHSKHIVIGAGIVGTEIARQLSQDKEQVLVIEAKTISSQTSKSSSKMLHGGIRYLENLDFKLVFEALREKNYWTKKLPKYAIEAPFYLPVYKESKWPLWIMKLGVFLYNLLSLFKNKKYANLSKKETLTKFPYLKEKGLRGSAAYSDAVIDDYNFTLEISRMAKENGAHFLENLIVKAINYNNQKYCLICYSEHLGEVTYTCDKLIIACGPFTDQVVRLFDKSWENIILPSKGSHLWIKHESLPVKSNMVLQTNDNRIIFIIKHEKAVLIGTTETILNENEVHFDIKATNDDIDYILNNVNDYLNGITLTRADILDSFCGIRPLVKEPGKNSSKTSREHKIFNLHHNMYIIAGGKYTTFRVMAKDLIKCL